VRKRIGTCGSANVRRNIEPSLPFCYEPYMKPVLPGNEKRRALPVAALDEKAGDPAAVAVEHLAGAKQSHVAGIAAQNEPVLISRPMVLAALNESSQSSDQRLPRLTMSAERSSEDRTDFRDVASVGASVLMVLGMFAPGFGGRAGGDGSGKPCCRSGSGQRVRG